MYCLVVFVSLFWKTSFRIHLHPTDAEAYNGKGLALYGLNYNPFIPEVPAEALYVPPKGEHFCWRTSRRTCARTASP